MELKNKIDVIAETIKSSAEFIDACEKIQKKLEEMDALRDELEAGREGKSDFGDLTDYLGGAGMFVGPNNKVKYTRVIFYRDGPSIKICIMRFGDIFDVVLYDNGTWELR